MFGWNASACVVEALEGLNFGVHLHFTELSFRSQV